MRVPVNNQTWGSPWRRIPGFVDRDGDVTMIVDVIK